MLTAGLFLFTAIWVVIIYGFDSWLARRPISLEAKPVLTYITVMAAIGVCGELITDTIYNVVFGHPLWEYQFLPVHGGYTSVYSLFLWGTLGFHMYLLGTIFQRKHVRSIHVLAGIFCIEALLLEVLINLTFLAAFRGSYVFYYNPPDLWHLTSLKAAPIYLLAGYLSYMILHFAHRRPLRSCVGCALLAIVLVGLGWFGGR